MVIQLRLALVAVAALCAMGVFATTMLSRAHAASSSCSMVKVDSGPALLSCHRGWFVGYPNMLKKGCRSVGVTSSSQLWVCPTKH